MSYEFLATEANELLPELQKIRRHLHTIPEFGMSLPNTLAYVASQVEGLGELTLNHELSAAALLIHGEKPGPTVLLRADMDALAVVEDTGLDFASTNGFMHACGHDLHMAIGVGAAKLLHANRDKIAGKVVVWFQPGEEGHGGADQMLEANMHLVSGEKPINAYGIHVFSSAPLGIFTSRKGPLMASAGDITVEFRGAGGHGSMPWLSKDPISVMAQSIGAIQNLIGKRFSPFDPVIVNVGWVRAGDDHTTNVIPETASFGATIRTFSDKNFHAVREALGQLVTSHAEAAGLEVKFEFSPASQVLNNEPAAIDRVARVAEQAFGPGRYENLPDPIPGGEDMASILNEMPGAFIFLGACPPDRDFARAATNHSNKAVFDDSVLGDGAALLAALALDTLQNPA
ncbi:MAG: M20 family metallopeptidase [Micrococcales bacterium]